MKKVITLDMIKSNKEFRTLIKIANDNLATMGYTEHGLRHVGYVSKTTANLLRELGLDERTIELGAIAGWIHDIGNVVNRKNHGSTGATLAFTVLMKIGMDISEVANIIGAVGNHEEETGLPVNDISAALIIADKSDAHRTRVHKVHFDLNDIHDRVNMSIKKNFLVVDKAHKVISLVIYMDDTSATMEYLQIYLTRINLCEKSATFLGYTFQLIINDVIINHHKSPINNALRLVKGEKEVSAD